MKAARFFTESKIMFLAKVIPFSNMGLHCKHNIESQFLKSELKNISYPTFFEQSSCNFPFKFFGPI